MAEFAEPYAARVITAMLGIPEPEWPVIARDSATLGLAMGVQIREHLEQIEDALGRLYAYADVLIADRRAAPRADCVTSLVKAHVDDDRLSEAVDVLGREEREVSQARTYVLTALDAVQDELKQRYKDDPSLVLT